jgi:hypothetical protein
MSRPFNFQAKVKWHKKYPLLHEPHRVNAQRKVKFVCPLVIISLCKDPFPELLDAYLKMLCVVERVLKTVLRTSLNRC